VARRGHRARRRVGRVEARPSSATRGPRAGRALTANTDDQTTTARRELPMPALPTSGPLAGLRVLDLTWVLSGPYCTMTLGDLGADVIKVERPPYGDVSRTTGPLVDGESGYFFSVNRGKRSISVDLKSEEGRALFLDLVREVDILVENFTP